MSTSGWRGWPREVTDQALHFAWAFASAWLVMAHFPVNIAGFASLLALAYREYEQWPPSIYRPWDPYVDWTFFALGLLAGALL